jgi:hypothetical protein
VTLVPLFCGEGYLVHGFDYDRAVALWSVFLLTLAEFAEWGAVKATLVVRADYWF